MISRMNGTNKKCVKYVAMTPQRLMESFVCLFEGDKVSLTEIELVFYSELNISSLIEKEFTAYDKHTQRLFDCWVDDVAFSMLGKEAFIEDLSFVALSLATVGTSDEKIHQFVDFVLAPKLFLFAPKSGAKAVHKEIVERVFDNFAHAEV